jgi:20S proteasome alpha/beta subunit
VTLIIGIICKDAIVLAADSQTTKGTVKQSGTNKISEIKFTNGNALVAEAGSASLSNRVVELFKRDAVVTDIVDDSTISKLLQKCLREVRHDLTSLHAGNISPKEQQEYFLDENNCFELMLAYYQGSKPRIYKFNPLWCIPSPAITYFETSGIASELANYILREHTAPGMDSKFASVIAIKVVKDAIDYVEGCGPPIRLATVHKPYRYKPIKRDGAGKKVYGDICVQSSRVAVCPSNVVEEIASIISKVEEETKSTRNNKIHKALKDQTESTVKQMQKMWAVLRKKDPESATELESILNKRIQNRLLTRKDSIVPLDFTGEYCRSSRNTI